MPSNQTTPSAGPGSLQSADGDSGQLQRALRRCATSREKVTRPPVAPRHKFWLGGYLLMLLALAVVYYLLRLHFWGFAAQYVPLLRRVTLGAMAAVLVLGLAKAIEVYAIARAQDAASRYNLQRVLRLSVYLLLAVIVVSVLFANWYAAAASLGLISLVVGFALQTPVTSMIGWIYILAREPYRVGDRIRIGDATGDVVDVDYLDTTLWEVGGEYVSTDHPSGRLIKFPNANVLSTAVYNYSWPVFPYIWNEITFQVGYDSDLAFVDQVMRDTVEAALGEAMIERVRTFREILAQTPVDQVEVNERPTVLFRPSSNTWMEATVRYVVDPKRAGSVKTRLIVDMLERLNAEPGRVRFPKGDSR
jgi:small-conductance mechanosensitive channel